MICCSSLREIPAVFPHVLVDSPQATYYLGRALAVPNSKTLIQEGMVWVGPSCLFCYLFEGKGYPLGKLTCTSILENTLQFHDSLNVAG